MKPMHPIEEMRAIYDCLPRLKCKKLCGAFCGPVRWSAIEDRVIMAKTGGMRLSVSAAGSCPYLHKGLCGIYEERPLLCRLWGLVDDVRMKCPHGCKPEPGYLTSEEGHELLRRMDALDPFAGSGTVVDVALRSGRIGIGVELSPDYIKLAQKRTENSRKQGVLI